MPSNSNSPKKLRNRSPTSPGAVLSAASIDGGTSLISCAVAERGDDLGAVDELVAVAVVAVGVGVDHGARSAPLAVIGHRVQHRRRQAEVEQRVDQQRRAVTDDETGVAPPPTTVGLEVGEAPVAELVRAQPGG